MVSLLRPAKRRVEKTGTKTKDFSECQSVVLIAESRAGGIWTNFDFGCYCLFFASSSQEVSPYLESAQKQNNGRRGVLTLEKVKREKRVSEERE